MVWSHNESWMVTGDHAGYVKYWQSNMNNVKMFQAHKEAIRGLRYSIHHTSPYVSCGTLIDNTPILAVVKTLNAAFTLFCFCVFSIRIASVSVFVWVQRWLSFSQKKYELSLLKARKYLPWMGIRELIWGESRVERSVW